MPLPTRQGTFTQWIFRSDTCRCGAPLSDQSDKASQKNHGYGSDPLDKKPPSEGAAEHIVGSNLFSGPIELFAERYEILEHLGTGASSQVDRANDRLLNKIVALKRLHKGRLNTEKILRFQQEAKILGNLRHPNLTCVLDCGVSEDNQPYLVMECEDGTTLEKTLSKQRLPMKTVVSIAIQVCDAMEYVHKQDVIHRDLSARNVMLVRGSPAPTSESTVKILDFGVARFVGQDRAGLDLTQPGQLVGNPLYMSPEQARDKNIDGRSDVYSLGCLLFHMLTGFPPYSGNSLMELVTQHINEPIPKIAELAKPLESDAASPLAESAWLALNRIVEICMAKLPEDRLQSMQHLKSELEAMQLPPANTASTQQAPASQHKDVLQIICALALTAAVFASISVWLLNRSSPSEKSLSAIDVRLSPTMQRPRDILFENGKSLSQLRKEIARGETRLDLTFAALTPEYFEAISQAKVIKNLILTDCTGVTREGIELLVQRKIPFRDLIIDGSDIRDDGLKAAAKLNGLRVVRMRQCLVHTTSHGIAHLATCPTLETLNANDTKLDDEGVAGLARSNTMNNLKMASTRITSKSAEYLSKAKQFEVLDFSETKFDDDGLKYLYKLPKLTMLYLRDLTVTDAGLEGFKNHKTLKNLYLAKSKGITDGAMETIRTLPRLENLDLSYTSVTPKSLPTLCRLRSLRVLEIAGLPFSRPDLFDLRRDLPNCKIVDNPNQQNSD